MKRKKIFFILAIPCLVILLIAGLQLLWRANYNSAPKRVSFYENEWQITLPRGMKLLFRKNQTYIDGSVEYTVFSCKSSPKEALMSEKAVDVEKQDFEKWLTDAINGLKIGAAQGEENYGLDFGGDYQYACFQSPTKLRTRYFFVVYDDKTGRLTCCREVRQNPHE